MKIFLSKIHSMKAVYKHFWLRNALVLAVIMLMYGVLIQTDSEVSQDPPHKKLIVLLYGISYFFFILLNNVLIVQPFLLKKNFKMFFLLEVLYVSLMSLFTAAYASAWAELNDPFSVLYIQDVVSNSLLCAMGIGIYFLHRWILNDVVMIKEKLQQRDIELSVLKSQMNPHFLLNALNNLYGFSMSQPQSLPQRILELSDLLRYQVEAVQMARVRLEDEVNAMKSYFTYESAKHPNLVLKVESIGEVTQVEVPPLLFMPLVENAVKFSLECNAPEVQVKWEFEQKKVTFYVVNNFDRTYRSDMSTKSGLMNLRRRLDIMELNSDFQVVESDNQFKATLALWFE